MKQTTYELMHKRGRKIVKSFRVEASSYSEALEKTKSKRAGWIRTNVRRVIPGETRHGGAHEVFWNWRNHIND